MFFCILIIITRSPAYSGVGYWKSCKIQGTSCPAYSRALAVLHTLGHWQSCILWGTGSPAHSGVLAVLHTLGYWQSCTLWGIGSPAHSGVLEVLHNLGYWKSCILWGTGSSAYSGVLAIMHDLGYWQYWPQNTHTHQERTTYMMTRHRVMYSPHPDYAVFKTQLTKQYPTLSVQQESCIFWGTGRTVLKTNSLSPI